MYRTSVRDPTFQERFCPKLFSSFFPDSFVAGQKNLIPIDNMFLEKTILCVRGQLDNITEDALKKSFEGAVQSFIVEDNHSGRKR